MTRAKDDLHLMVPQRFFTHGQSAQGDRHVYASRTRFIADRLLDLFEKTTWPLPTVGTGHVLQGKARVSMSVPTCAACGAERRSKLCFKTTRRSCRLHRARSILTVCSYFVLMAWTIELMKSVAKSAL